ncbi:MAG: hypothetical protein GY913_18845 [Proteobacteria bacterium]|nr:hypothetical protein [Pseudomonadota bacterium]MCP4918969.1 hypothetical protein [Pseudomonadota bacterium]
MPSRLYAGDERAWTLHADGVAAWAEGRGATTGTAPTGLAPSDPLFAGEWDLAACQMTVLGLVQVVERFPETAGRYLPAVRACGDWLATEESRAFGAARWGHDDLGAAYVGYSALPLARQASIDPDFGHALPLAAMTSALEARLPDPVHTFETYPGEVYPADLSVVAAALPSKASTSRSGWSGTSRSRWPRTARSISRSRSSMATRRTTRAARAPRSPRTSCRSRPPSCPSASTTAPGTRRSVRSAGSTSIRTA